MKQDLVLADVKIINLESEQYGLIGYMPLNRPVTEAGVKKMKKSVMRNGCQRDVIVYWDAKKNKYFVIDGQHLVKALIELDLPIRCRVNENKSETEITQLMIDLNNTSKSWKLEDYVHGWKESGKKDYRVLENAHTVIYADIQLSVIIQAYTQQNRAKATKMVKEGTFTIVDRAKGEFYIDCVYDCSNFLPNTRQLNEALIKLMLSLDTYDHKRMIKNLKSAVKHKLDFSHTSEKAIFDTLLSIYDRK
jgi:hypothetical protein